MKNSLFKELKRRKTQTMMDLNLHEFSELLKHGYTEDEISRELGVEKSFVKKLKEEVEKDW